MLASRPLRILVVDDDPAMVGAITALVGTEGHQVITAYDGLTAVKRFREEAPDLVLLDLAMPGPDGFTVAGQIRAAGQAPILVVSGESAEEAKVRALGIGADDYLVKPFGKAELLARIAAVMRRVDRATGGPATGPVERGRARPGAGASRGAGRRHRPDAHPDGVPPARGAGPGERRHRSAPSPRPGRLAGRDGSGPALAQAPPRPAAGEGRGAGGPQILAVRGVGYRIEARVAPSRARREGERLDGPR